MALLRLFLATTPTDALRARMVRTQDTARAQFRHARWIKTENLHLTLKFLGAIPAERLPDVAATAQQCALRSQPFSLSLGPLLALPSARHARVLTLGCTTPECLLSLHTELDRAYLPMGFEDETRAFRPHITLARFLKPTPMDLTDPASRIWENEIWPVSQMTLLQSRPAEGGSVYTPIESRPLGA